MVQATLVHEPEYADQIGADKYCRDAMETVRWAEETEKQLLEDK